ncbi:hypothetical protein EYF80_028770 [Liparis tanakae]|uniref:Uncharacterized protein n=1 Tax=Liparis tanakae TaxID=230148 RepID=A0A4Z2H8A9_9TELE|nr:hypothetical protein EYF80_028770 [Liparis tanakae]
MVLRLRLKRGEARRGVWAPCKQWRAGGRAQNRRTTEPQNNRRTRTQLRSARALTFDRPAISVHVYIRLCPCETTGLGFHPPPRQLLRHLHTEM